MEIKSDLAKKIFLFLINLEVFFFLADFIFIIVLPESHFSIQKIFNMAREDSLASWFSSIQLLIISLTFLLSGHLGFSKLNKDKHFFRSTKILSGFFLYLAIDDGAILHERLSTAITDSLSSNLFSFFPSYYWQVIFLPVILILASYMVAFFWKEIKSAKLKKTLFLSFFLFALAIIIDFFEGATSNELNLFKFISDSFVVNFETVEHLAKSVEESLELMAFSSIFYVWTKYFLLELKKIGRFSLDVEID